MACLSCLNESVTMFVLVSSALLGFKIIFTVNLKPFVQTSGVEERGQYYVAMYV